MSDIVFPLLFSHEAFGGRRWAGENSQDTPFYFCSRSGRWCAVYSSGFASDAEQNRQTTLSCDNQTPDLFRTFMTNWRNPLNPKLLRQVIRNRNGNTESVLTAGVFTYPRYTYRL